jgi:hypothetical protein
MAQIDINAFANYALDTFDFSADYEADEFVVEFEGQRLYVERKARWFTVHVGAERVRLPRC